MGDKLTAKERREGIATLLLYWKGHKAVGEFLVSGDTVKRAIEQADAILEYEHKSGERLIK